MLKYFRNRKSMGWLLGAFLLILVIFAFVAFYIPDFMQDSAAPGSRGGVAWVDDAPITSQEFLQRFRAQDAQYRQQMGAQYDPALLRQLGIDNYVVQQLVMEKVLSLEAERQGLVVPDEEVGKEIQNDPSLQRDGRFIGKDAYLNLLSGVGLTPASYEEQVRGILLRQKLENLVKDAVVVTEADVEEEYRRRNEKVRLEYVFVPESDFEEGYEPTDEEVRAYYDAHPEEFERPVQRKARVITLTPQLFTTAVTVTDREIERYYNQNQHRFSTPEQVQASHILFKVGPDSDEQAVRAKAEAVLARARAGEDFATLARELSEDTSAEQGGDLGFFGRGQMVPEFEAAAFSLPVGGISDLVRTQYGYHIIKVTDRQDAMTQPLDAVREQIRGTLTQEKATELLDEAVESASEKLRGAGSVDALTAEYELLVPQDTGFFGPNDPVPQLSNSVEAARAAFDVDVGEVTPAVRIGGALGGGYAFLQVLEERPAGIAPFEEVEVEAREKLRHEHAMRLAKARAEELREKLLAGEEDVELKTHESFFRGTRLPDAGSSVDLQVRAFELPVGELSEPLEAERGYVVARVVERTGFDSSTFAAQKRDFERQLRDEQRSRVWGAFVAALQARYPVRVDWKAIRAITG